MPLKHTQTPYPLIDSDPHFGRVVRYMRASDYATWAGAAAAGPGVLYLYGESDERRASEDKRVGGSARKKNELGVSE